MAPGGQLKHRIETDSVLVNGLKIGYQPLSPTLTSAGDRRRLLFWAKDRGHTVVTDLSRKVDIIVASENSNFQSKYFAQKKVPVIFDLIDAYLSPLNPYDDFVRGLAKKLSGQISGGIKSYSHHVRDFCIDSDAVICSSIEQEAVIQTYNSNTHVILDSHDEIPFTVPKHVRNTSLENVQILWEGQPATIRGVQQISSVLSQLSKEIELQFDFVTDEKYFRVLGKYLEMNTLELLKKDLAPIIDHVKIVPWTLTNLVNSAKESVVAIIPINFAVPMQRLKPENRLLIMWRLGLPCLTSPSPAYIRVARAAGVNAICESPDDWLKNFRTLVNYPTFAYEEILRGQNYLQEHHNRISLLKKWDKAIESVIG